MEIGTVSQGDSPIYNTGTFTCDADAWTCDDWLQWHGLLYIQYGADAHFLWCQAWNDPANNITSMCWRTYYCTQDSGFLDSLAAYGILFEEMRAYLYNTLAEKDIIVKILENDEKTYLNIVKANAYLDQVPTPLLVPPLSDIADVITMTAATYNARQQWLRDNSDGNYVEMTEGNWTGSDYELGVAPLIYIAIAAVIGIAVGATAVYALTTTDVDAALDRITSDQAWIDLCAYDPAKCAELESKVEAELLKVKKEGKVEGTFNGLKMTGYTAFLLVGGYLWWKNQKE